MNAIEAQLAQLPMGLEVPKNNLNHPDIRLFQADSTTLQVLEKNSIDLLVISPPYNLGKAYTGNVADDSLDYNDYMQFTEKWLANCFAWVKNTGRLCVNVPIDKNKFGKRPPAADLIATAMQIGWKYHATIVWNEGTISRRTAWGSWKSASAPHVISPVALIIVFYKGA